jgi:hypothetical protein
MITKELTIETAKETVKIFKEKFSQVYVSIHKNPCEGLKPDDVESLPWIVFFNAGNPLNGSWGYVSTKEKAKEIRREVK